MPSARVSVPFAASSPVIIQASIAFLLGLSAAAPLSIGDTAHAVKESDAIVSADALQYPEALASEEGPAAALLEGVDIQEVGDVATGLSSPPSLPLCDFEVSEDIQIVEAGTTLQATVDNARPGTVLMLLPGNYTGTGEQVLAINKELTLKACRSGMATLDGEGIRPVLSVASSAGAAFHGLRIMRGRTTGMHQGGGATVLSGTATFNSCIIQGNQAGAVSNVFQSVMSFNVRGLLHELYLGAGGGVLVVGGTATFDSCEIRENDALLIGGGVSVLGGTVTMKTCNVSENTADDGGGIYIAGTSTQVAVTGSQIRSNSADVIGPLPGQGGGLYLASGRLTVSDSQIGGNSAENITKTTVDALYVSPGSTATLDCSNVISGIVTGVNVPVCGDA